MTEDRLKALEANMIAMRLFNSNLVAIITRLYAQSDRGNEIIELLDKYHSLSSENIANAKTDPEDGRRIAEELEKIHYSARRVAELVVSGLEDK
ncbi:MAG: hypothetical protein AAFO74_12190 [Pseudomonadota bacterium]